MNKKNQHYISTSYLKKFWFDDKFKKENWKNKCGYLYDFKEDKIVIKNTDKMFYKKYIFTNYDVNFNKNHHIEDFFWNIETNCMNVIKKIEENIKNIEEWNIKNLQLDWLNSSKIVELLMFFVKRLILLNFLQKKSNWFMIHKKYIDSNLLFKFLSRNINNDYIYFLFNWDSAKNFKEFIYNNVFEYIYEEKIYDLLMNLHWNIIYTSGSDLTFITWDFPIFFNWESTNILSSLKSKYCRIIFPLTKNILLDIWNHSYKNWNLNYIKQNNFEEIIALNTMIATNCENQIFWYTDEILKYVINNLKYKKYTPNNNSFFYDKNIMNNLENVISINDNDSILNNM